MREGCFRYIKMIIFCIWHFTTKKYTKQYFTFITIHYYKNIPIICYLKWIFNI